MFGLRLAKSRVLLLVLLPFLFMAVASPFTHICIETPLTQSAPSAAHHAPGHNAVALAVTAVSPPIENESCGACTWAQSTSTPAQAACTIHSVAPVTDFAHCKYEPQVAVIFHPHGPRAPPVS